MRYLILLAILMLTGCNEQKRSAGTCFFESRYSSIPYEVIERGEHGYLVRNIESGRTAYVPGDLYDTVAVDCDLVKKAKKENDQREEALYSHSAPEPEPTQEQNHEGQ